MSTSTRNRYHEHSISCQNCGGIFTATRYDAKYCGVNCRKVAARKALEVKERASAIVIELENFANKYGGSVFSTPLELFRQRDELAKRRPEMVEELLRIRETLNELIDRYDY